MSNVTPMGTNMPRGFSPSELATIKATVAKDTNELEFNLFMAYCRRKGFDPFAKEVVAVVFNKDPLRDGSPNPKRRMEIITTQAGLRSTALDNPTYGPERTKPEYTFDEKLKGPTNPHGIIDCTVTLWKKDIQSGVWHPAVGVAYWDEYVPIVTDPRAFVTEETGEFWPDGNPKKRKRLKEDIDLRDFQTVDDSGQWKKMGRKMLAKCARMEALRAGWKEYSGVYGEEEFHRAIAEDKSASELVEQDREDRRMKLIGASKTDYWIADNDGNISTVSAGQYGDNLPIIVGNPEIGL
jgi:phage recombination protein Bet